MATDAEPIAGALLALLGERDRERLLAPGVRRSFGRDEVLHREGDPSTHVLLLMSGWIRASVSTPDGQVVVLALRGPGDVLGELAAVNGQPRSATVRSIEPVEVVQLTGEQFLAIVRNEPAVALALIRNLSSRLHGAEMARLGMATLGVGQRVALHLHEMALEHGVRGPGGLTIGIPLSQQQIADRIGASRRAVSRAVTTLRERGVLVTRRERIVVLRPDVLRALAVGHQV